MNDDFLALKDIISPDKFCLYVYFREWGQEKNHLDDVTFDLALDLHRKVTPENYLAN